MRRLIRMMSILSLLSVAMVSFSQDHAPEILFDYVTLEQGGLIDQLVEFGDHYYFITEDEAHGMELWRTDGKSVGDLLFDFVPGPETSFPRFMRTTDTHLFLGASNGTSGTFWSFDGNDTTSLIQYQNYSGQTATLPDRIYVDLRAFDGEDRLFMSDGTRDGTIEVHPDIEEVSSFSNLLTFHDALYYLTTGQDWGWWFYQQDSATIRLRDRNPGDRFIAVDSTLFFSTSDSLFKVDGTDFELVLDSGSVRELIKDGDDIYMIRYDNDTGMEEVRRISNGTSTLLYAARDLYNLILVNGISGPALVFIAQTPEYGYELMGGRISGDFQGAVLVDLYPGSLNSRPDVLAVHDGHIYFKGHHPEFGEELWHSDGTPDGTHMIMDAVAGQGSGDPVLIAQNDQYLVFSVRSDAYGREFWQVTSPGQIELVTDLETGPDASGGPLFITDAFIADQSVIAENVYVTGSGCQLRKINLETGDITALSDITNNNTLGSFFTFIGTLFDKPLLRGDDRTDLHSSRPILFDVTLEGLEAIDLVNLGYNSAVAQVSNHTACISDGQDIWMYDHNQHHIQQLDYNPISTTEFYSAPPYVFCHDHTMSDYILRFDTLSTIPDTFRFDGFTSAFVREIHVLDSTACIRINGSMPVQYTNPVSMRVEPMPGTDRVLDLFSMDNEVYYSRSDQSSVYRLLSDLTSEHIYEHHLSLTFMQGSNRLLLILATGGFVAIDLETDSVIDVNTLGFSPFSMARAGDNLYVTKSGSELYHTDLGTGETHMIYNSDIGTGLVPAGDCVGFLHKFGDQLGLAMGDTVINLDLADYGITGIFTPLVSYHGDLYFSGHSDAYGQGEIWKVEISDGSVNVTPVFNSEELHIYPNPTTQFCTLEYPREAGPGVISIFDQAGRFVKSIKTTTGSTPRIDLGGLPPGSYALVFNGQRYHAVGMVQVVSE